MPDQIKIKVLQTDGSEDSCWTLPGKSVYQVLELMGLNAGGTCAGAGTCGKCKVRVEGQVSRMDASEQSFLMPEEIRNGQRLACCCKVHGEATIYLDLIPSEYNVKQRVLKYKPPAGKRSGAVYKTIFIPGRQSDITIPLYDRIQQALPAYQLNLSMDNLNSLHKIDRPGRPTLELQALILEEQEVCLVEREQAGVLGLALDLGTTSLFASLLDLETGEVLAMAAQSNMQRIYGQDIISRLTYAQQNHDGAEALHIILINNINAMIADMTGQTGHSTDRIYKITAVGNPVMLHFFLGLDTVGFHAAPYVGLFSAAMQINAASLELHVNARAKLHVLPQVGGFVGADTTACLLTLSKCFKNTFLLCDIGTNGEIVICNKGKLWACSAAAGPALEGGALRSGMRAGPGAIEHFSIKDQKLEYEVIGGELPKGLCGSAVIDLIACLLEIDCLSKEGIFTPTIAEYFQAGEGSRGQEIILVAADAASGNTAIVLNQEDIRQIQLAKGAIRTAIDFLLKEAGLQASDLERIYLAGAFGTYLNADSLIKIGLLPEIKREKVVNIGNAAAEGAMMALVSKERLEEATKIKQQLRTVDLANQPGFQEVFIANLGF